MGKSYKERKNMILNLMGNDLYVPMKEKELAVFVQVMPEDRPVLSSILKELLEEKKIEIEILAIDNHPLLSFNEGETIAQFHNELL